MAGHCSEFNLFEGTRENLVSLQTDSDPQIRAFLESLGANEGYAEELFRAYQSNPRAVSDEWRAMFDAVTQANGQRGMRTDGASQARPLVAARPAVPVLEGDVVQPLRGVAARIAGNMEASLGVPTATSQRTIPMRLLEENRRVLNSYLARRKAKLAMTPIIGWALVRAAREFPALNAAFTEADGQPARVDRGHVNFGLAVDVEGRNGQHSLLVPVVKKAETLNFAEFMRECDRLIKAARGSKISPEDLQGASLSLTNPGTIGTRASVPRLMPGQGCIIAAGAVAYPSGFEGMPEETLYSLGIGKVTTFSCTYDHRIIQGAESGAFLARVHALLLGEDGFYDQIFHDLQIPFHPVRWSVDAAPIGLGTTNVSDQEQIRKQSAVFQLVHAYRVRGHLMSDTDPLGYNPMEHPELDPQHYGLSLWDLDRRFVTSLVGGAAQREDHTMSLREILDVVRSTYCGTLSCEFMHMQRLEERTWLQEQMEPTRNHWPLPPETRLRALRTVTQAEAFERLLHTRYIGHKRFSLEGAEALIPALDHLFELAAGDSIPEAVIGMAHRGRLNVLSNIVGKTMNEIFSKFEDADPRSVEGSGDVKYHIGATGKYVSPAGTVVDLTLVPNPSHLEVVDPVVEGSARALQTLRGDKIGTQALPVLLHGDAAFAGQGVVVETLNLSQLDGYRTGGTIHIVINNRIGFTTSPVGARSSLYCTDVARTVQAPIFHVNGDSVDAVLRAMDLAFRFRQQFHKDVVIDLVCYRRHGHNEGDDPSLTQPVLYRRIEQQPSVRSVYAGRLAKEGAIGPEEGQQLYNEIYHELDAKAAEPHEPPAPEPLVESQPLPSAAPEERLVQVGAALTRLPEDFHVHPKLKSFLDKRHQAIAERGHVDWSLAEALAFGTLTLEGIPIRITGQDTGRGTFSQRHAVLYDYEDGRPFKPLQYISPDQAKFSLYDSLLSEEAALGFEFGYSMTHPRALVLWEAQFGDFANGAQVIIDQFLSVSMTKWARSSGLVMLLPHGYEGQGPEHSSARIERFLQLCAEDNLQVANCTTAAQYFHLLRQQGLLPLTAPITARRPLILFTPKSLLRHPDVTSPLSDLASGHFYRVLPEAELSAEEVRKVLFCSGKVFYDLLRGRRTARDRSTAIVRLEALYPFPDTELEQEIARYPQAQEWAWVQEEPANMGPWSFIAPRLQRLLGDRRLDYVGRAESPSPATGSLRLHQEQQAAIVQQALALPMQVAAD